MPDKNTRRIWITGAMRRQAETLAPQDSYWKALEAIEEMKETSAMKHVLAAYSLSLALEGKKVPEKPLARRKTASFQEGITKVLREDQERFRISSLVSIICAVLCCMFVRSMLLDTYLINFSVDALVAAAAAAGLLVNLGVSFRTIRIYGSIRDFLLTDVLAVILWYLLFMLWPQFDTSLGIFLLAWLFERRKFAMMIRAFANENGFTAPDQK